MPFWELIKNTKLALKNEDETQLCYLYGKGYAMNYQIKKTIFKGFFFRSLIFFFILFKNFSFFSKKIISRSIYIYAGSKNDFETLKSTITILNDKKKSFHLEVNETISYNDVSYLPKSKLSFFLVNPKIIFVACIMFIFKGFQLYLKLRKLNKKNVINYYFNVFCEVYLFLPYYFEKLSKIKPKLIIISNDHSVNYRALRLVAETLKIKTLYMQHAGVTKYFPPLEFDYALLDGMIAHQTYIKCYQIQKKNKRIERNIKKCQIFLSGQKKKFQIKNFNNNKKKTIGIATGTLDNFQYLKPIINNVLKLGLNCDIRFHPAQPASFISKIEEYSKNMKYLKLSYPKKESLSIFFSKVDAVIAFRTSLHLEAAIAGLPTFFIKMFRTNFKSDSYGYVESGLSFKLNKDFNISKLNSLILKSNNSKRKKIIRNFSETYDTIWQNNEHKLVFKIIENIIEKKNKPVQIFKKIDNEIYQKVFKLK